MLPNSWARGAEGSEIVFSYSRLQGIWSWGQQFPLGASSQEKICSLHTEPSHTKPSTNLISFPSFPVFFQGWFAGALTPHTLPSLHTTPSTCSAGAEILTQPLHKPHPPAAPRAPCKIKLFSKPQLLLHLRCSLTSLQSN